MRTKSFKLAINECPKHGYRSVTIDQEFLDGGGIGSRISPTKCCGSWKVVQSWSLPAFMWESVIREAKLALRFTKQQEKKSTATQGS